MIQIGQIGERDSIAHRVYDPDGIATSLRAEGGGQGAKTGLYVVGKLGNHQQDIVYSERGNMCSLPRGTHGSTKHLTKTMLNNGRIRRLTPTECERLQGFPDGWTEGVSDTQRYKCLGNAVTTNVIEYIARRIYNYERKGD